MPIVATAFDIDGTLYPNARMYLHSLPFFATHPRLVRAYARIRKKVRAIRPINDLQALERELLAEELGVSPAEAARKIDVCIHGKWESVFARVRPYPFVRESVGRLREAGIRVAVTSDFPVERKLKLLGFDDLFECRLWSEESGYLKPHPEPFLELANCLGAAPSDILYVGNNYEYDIVGAKAVGMRAAHLRGRPMSDSIADLTFNDYRRLADWILAVNAGSNPS